MGGAKGVDHINHDGLDNRRANLRLATPSQNLGNKRPQRGGSSPYKGVSLQTSWHPIGRPWKASIDIDGRTKSIGYFATEVEAANAYDEAAIAKWGDFALTNKKAVS
jgi:hypothetical protein